MTRQLTDEATVAVHTAHHVGHRVTAVEAVGEPSPAALGERLPLGFEEQWAVVLPVETLAPERRAE